MLASRLGCALFLTVLAGCGPGEPTASAPSVAPRLLAGGAKQAAAAPFITFTAYRSQYTILPSQNGYMVTDILTGAAQEVPANSRLRFGDTAVALDFTGTAGAAYRMYLATLDRAPDVSGLGFHINNLDSGVAPQTVAGNFVGSEEFQAKYGPNISNAQFVTLLYANVLHRQPDEGGLAWHVQHLDGTNVDGVRLSRTDTVLNFSGSAEFISQVQPSIASGMEYLPWGSSLPANAAIDYAGSYAGTLSGAEQGSFNITIGNDGAMQGQAVTNAQTLAGNAKLPAGGRFVLTLVGNTAQTVTMAGSINLATGVAAGVWSNGTTGGSGVFSLVRAVVVQPPPPPPPVQFAQVQAIVVQRCVGCHSARPTIPGFNPAPLGIRFDTEDQIRSQSARIFSSTVQSQFMPWANMTSMTQAERDVFAAWFAAGMP